MLIAQSCLTLCDPMDYNLPGSSVHGILQARILEWVATPSPRDLSDPGIKPVSLMSPALQVGSSALSHQGSPKVKMLAEVKRCFKRRGNLGKKIVRMEGEGITRENMGYCKQDALGAEKEMGFFNKRG